VAVASVSAAIVVYVTVTHRYVINTAVPADTIAAVKLELVTDLPPYDTASIE